MKSRRITALIALLLCAGLAIGFMYPIIAGIAESAPRPTATPAPAATPAPTASPLAMEENAVPQALPETGDSAAPEPTPTPAPEQVPAPAGTQKPNKPSGGAPIPTQAVPVEPGTTVTIEDDPVPVAMPGQ